MPPDEIAKARCRGVIFAIETGGHYWRNFTYFLEEIEIPFRLVNKITLKRMSDGCDINRSKSDFRDAEMAANILRSVTSPRPNSRRAYMRSFVALTARISGWSKREAGL